MNCRYLKVLTLLGISSLCLVDSYHTRNAQGSGNRVAPDYPNQGNANPAYDDPRYDNQSNGGPAYNQDDSPLREVRATVIPVIVIRATLIKVTAILITNRSGLRQSSPTVI